MTKSKAIDALDVSEAAAKNTNTGSSESIIQGCDLIRAGIFFDGTGNSRDHVGKGGGSWHTNIDLMESKYLANPKPEVLSIYGQSRKVLYLHRYMRGIGVKSNGQTTSLGTAIGMGPEGVYRRVHEAKGQILQDIKNKLGDMDPCEVWFDTFGFSRGADAARFYANLVKDGDISFNNAKVTVKFMGLFDTVSSLGSAGNTGNGGDVDIGTQNTAERIYHITAKDEIREFFPLTLAKAGKKIEVVGAHSDIGGGYDPNDPTHRVTTFEWREDWYPGLAEFYQTRWRPMDGNIVIDITEDQDVIEVVDRSSIDRKKIRTMTQIRNVAEHGLQFVSLKLMHKEAVEAGVPFAQDLGSSIAQINISLPEDLQAYYDALVDGNVDSEMEIDIRRKYAHFSVNNKWSADIIQANVPTKDAVRVVDIL